MSEQLNILCLAGPAGNNLALRGTRRCVVNCILHTQVVPEIKELVEDLRARRWRVVIVTASPTWIVEPGARRLGIASEDILGIEVHVDVVSPHLIPRRSKKLGGRIPRHNATVGENVPTEIHYPSESPNTPSVVTKQSRDSCTTDDM